MDGVQPKAPSAPSASATSAAEPSPGRDPGQPAGSTTQALTAEDVRFELLRNALYHGDRLGFFERSHRLVMFITTLAGTAAAGGAFLQSGVPTLVSGSVVAIVSTLDLVCDLGGAARTHEKVRQRCFDLMADLEECATGDEGTCRRILADLVRTYGEEPHTMAVVDALAWNGALAATTKPGELYEDNLQAVTRWQRWTRNVFCHADLTFMTRRETRAMERRRRVEDDSRGAFHEAGT